MIEKLKQVKKEFIGLQDYISSAINDCDERSFFSDEWDYEPDVKKPGASSEKITAEKTLRESPNHPQLKPEGGGRSMVLEKGSVFEKAGVNFSAIKGNALPKAATQRKPELIDCEFHATGVSIVIHPENPFLPTSHANVRFFIAETAKGPVWWFGGGFDLTPYYPFKEDCVYWHQQAKMTCDKYGEDIYSKFKTQCDDYFYLKHRNEHRGIGGLFYDDFNELGFEDCFKLSLSVGKTFIDSYMEIIKKRMNMSYTNEQREFQCYRRGRYAEFNMVYDRGTIFGLQSGGRTESILMSLPPVVYWQYNRQFSKDSPEHELTNYFLKPQDWVNL